MLSVRKIAILGNSHVSALKEAWEEIQNLFPMISISFFARPDGVGSLKGLEIKCDRLEPSDPQLRDWFIRTAGTNAIDIKKFDCFIIYGYGTPLKFLYTNEKNQGAFFYSSQFLSHVPEIDPKNQAIDIIKKNLGTQMYQLPKLIRTVSDVPIYNYYKPLFSEGHPLDNEGNHLNKLLYACYINELQRVYKQNLNCDVIPQPPETLSEKGFTLGYYAKSDYYHMNSKYGKLTLTSFFHETLRIQM